MYSAKQRAVDPLATVLPATAHDGSVRPVTPAAFAFAANRLSGHVRRADDRLLLERVADGLKAVRARDD
jgi:hypothetical protein